MIDPRNYNAKVGSLLIETVNRLKLQELRDGLKQCFRENVFLLSVFYFIFNNIFFNVDIAKQFNPWVYLGWLLFLAIPVIVCLKNVTFSLFYRNNLYAVLIFLLICVLLEAVTYKVLSRIELPCFLEEKVSNTLCYLVCVNILWMICIIINVKRRTKSMSVYTILNPKVWWNYLNSSSRLYNFTHDNIDLPAYAKSYHRVNDFIRSGERFVAITLSFIVGVVTISLLSTDLDFIIKPLVQKYFLSN